MKLLIVESPSKAKTIEKYLDDASTTAVNRFTVRASVGHVRDLPKSNKQAIDIEGGFIPHYEISKGKEKIDLLRQLQSINNNLYLQLQKLLPTDSFDFLTRLLAKSVLSLPIDQANIVALNDETALRSFAKIVEQRLSANRLELPGLLLDLSALEPNLIIKTAQELETEIGDCERQLLELNSLLKTVETLSQQKQQQQKLEQQITELTKDEKNYEEFLSLQEGSSERLLAIEGLKQKLSKIMKSNIVLSKSGSG